MINPFRHRAHEWVEAGVKEKKGEYRLPVFRCLRCPEEWVMDVPAIPVAMLSPLFLVEGGGEHVQTFAGKDSQGRTGSG
jgi:hypothetical protein